MLRTLLLAGLATAATLSTANATVFDLSTVATGTTPTFSIISGGVTETYSSPAGNGFSVQSTSGLFSFSPALIDNNYFGSDSLTITFSTPQINQIRIPFAIQDAFGSGDTLSITTNTGQNLTFGSGGDGLPLNEPEGTISFVPTGTGVTSLTLSSNIAFAVGNTIVPEPASLTILAAGLIGGAMLRRRRAN